MYKTINKIIITKNKKNYKLLNYYSLNNLIIEKKKIINYVFYIYNLLWLVMKIKIIDLKKTLNILDKKNKIANIFNNKNFLNKKNNKYYNIMYFLHKWIEFTILNNKKNKYLTLLLYIYNII